MVDRAPKVKTPSTSTRRPRRDIVLAMPLAAQTHLPAMLHQTTAELMGMNLVSTLLGWTPDLTAPRLAPPVLEWVTADCRRALERASAFLYSRGRSVTWVGRWGRTARRRCPGLFGLVDMTLACLGLKALSPPLDAQARGPGADHWLQPQPHSRDRSYGNGESSLMCPSRSLGVCLMPLASARWRSASYSAIRGRCSAASTPASRTPAHRGAALLSAHVAAATRAHVVQPASPPQKRQLNQDDRGYRDDLVVRTGVDAP